MIYMRNDMTVNNFEPEQFTGALDGVIESCTHDMLKQIRLTLEKAETKQESSVEGIPFETVYEALFRSVLEKMAEHYKKDETHPVPMAVRKELELLLEQHRSEIETAAKALHQNLCQEILQWQARMKAQEIARKTVQTLLAGVLPGLDLGCFYSVSGDTVHLNLTKKLTASIDLPLRELSEFLFDPARIEAALKAAPPAGIKESSRPSRPWSPGQPNIIYP